MRDVAALARVSLKTVSRVVNGETTVAPELAARVQRAVATLDYRPNLTAANLCRETNPEPRRLAHGLRIAVLDRRKLSRGAEIRTRDL
jgi:hypothetical protein